MRAPKPPIIKPENVRSFDIESKKNFLRNMALEIRSGLEFLNSQEVSPTRKMAFMRSYKVGRVIDDSLPNDVRQVEAEFLMSLDYKIRQWKRTCDFLKAIDLQPDNFSKAIFAINR